MTTPTFCDVSQFQPASIDWQAYKTWAMQGDGVSRVAIRSSYGNGYRDVFFDTHRSGALSAGIDQIIFYHYSYPQINNAIDEANAQFSIVGSIRDQDMLILDFEESVAKATSDWAYQWLVQQQANYGGKLPGLYASTAYIQQRLQDVRLEPFALWEANWQFTPDERPPVPYPWKTRLLLQYTDSATNIPGIQGTVDCNIFLGPEGNPVTIDLTNPTVASHFINASNNPLTWRCIETGFTLHGEILAFYQSYGGNDLCGLTHLGLPLSGENTVPNHPGIVWQAFERGVMAFDPDHVLDGPPGAGRVYMLHIDKGLGMDPRIGQLATQNADLTNQLATLQGENDALKAILAASSLGQISTLGQQIADDVALIMQLAAIH